MSETTDGFKIAEADMEIRGPGGIFGIRQSGFNFFLRISTRTRIYLKLREILRLKIIEEDTNLKNLSTV